MLRIVAPHFVAGAVITDNRCVRAAPIVKYMRGWTVPQICVYAARKRWQVEKI